MRVRKPGPCLGGCGKTIKRPPSRCSTCAKKWRREKNPETYFAMKQRAREARLARGLCMYCNQKPQESKRYCNNCLKKLKGRARAERQKLREEVIKHYGEKCACCGESRMGFLSIDHTNGGGNKHRKELKAAGISLYKWLKENQYPNGFRVLCFNCNCAIGIYGSCPHHQ